MRVLIASNPDFLGNLRKPFFNLHCWLVNVATNSPCFFLYPGGFGRPRYFSGRLFQSLIALRNDFTLYPRLLTLVALFATGVFGTLRFVSRPATNRYISTNCPNRRSLASRKRSRDCKDFSRNDKGEIMVAIFSILFVR